MGANRSNNKEKVRNEVVKFYCSVGVEPSEDNIRLMTVLVQLIRETRAAKEHEI